MNRTKTFAVAVLVACLAFAMLPGTALSISPDQVISRGKVWVGYTRVDSKTGKKLYGVPYSQSKWALESGSPVPAGTSDPSVVGYRTDCSGFASLCLNLRDSSSRPYSTCTHDMGVGGVGAFKGKFFGISKAQLQPGDLVLKSDAWKISGSGHVIVFDGWANSAQTSFWALEQTTSSSHNGTILHTRTYGEAGYRPFRYAGVDQTFSDCEQSVSGTDRYSTAAAAVDVAFPASTTVSVPALVVASGDTWPDALGGSALAGAVGGPLLLTKKATLPSAMGAEISRLKPKCVYVLGSTAAVSDAVATGIASTYHTSVVRLGGSDRYETARLVAHNAVTKARAAKRTVSTAFVTTGVNFPDAVAASPISAKTSWPILLTNPKGLSPSARSALHDLGVKNVILLGGKPAVSSKVESQLKKAGDKVSRLAGPSRYQTALAIARYGAGLRGMGWGHLGLASGTAFPDALSGGAAQGFTGGLLVLTPMKSLDSGVRSEIAKRRSAIGMVRVFGGLPAISQNTRFTLAAALRTVP